MSVSLRGKLARSTGTIGLVALLLATLLGLAGPAAVGAAPTPATAGSYYAEPTGHILAGAFFQYWANHEGMTVLGLPVTEAVPWDGGEAQFFQYGALRSQIGAGGAPTVSPIAAGTELVDSANDPNRLVSGRRVGGVHTLPAAALPSTAGSNHTLAAVFKNFYTLEGGAKRFGQAISDTYQLNGDTIQWFEYGRLQQAPDVPEGAIVAPVGQELAEALGIDTGQVARGNQPLLDLKRYKVYSGDGTIPMALGPFDPTHIQIPSINVEANIEQVGIQNGVMGIPQNAWNVGWYPQISQPGHDTNVVMAGHKDWWGIGPTIFANLQNVQVGDKIYLTAADGSGFTYRVTSVDSVPADVSASDVVGDTGSETLTLITCDGAFDGQEYLSRLIVRAARI